MATFIVVRVSARGDYLIPEAVFVGDDGTSSVFYIAGVLDVMLYASARGSWNAVFCTVRMHSTSRFTSTAMLTFPSNEEDSKIYVIAEPAEPALLHCARRVSLPRRTNNDTKKH